MGGYMYKKAMEVLNKFSQNGYLAYIVGGYPRDNLLGINTKDIDICTNAKPIEIMKLFDTEAISDVKYGSVKVIYKNFRFDVTTFRKDIKYEDIYIDLDKNYYFLQLDESGKDEFKKEMGYVPTIVKVSVERLGKMVDLGSQRCEAIDDDSDFNVYFGNIFYKNVKYVGEKRDMPIIIKKYSEIHTIENVRAENCDFEIQGWEGRR